ncbi:MAG: flavodoxin family protein [Proteobacteria bacterium]|nr:flavodoxin family protein [Pseudomonadota bacterium]
MSPARHLLIVSHAPSANTRALTESVVRGASHPDIDGIVVRLLAPLEAGPPDVLWSHGLILGTTENFGYMSGALKDFFDRIYYPCLESTQGRPYALFIRAGNDGTGARTSIERIVTGLRWRAVAPPVIAAGPFQAAYVEQCEELGMTLAAGLEAGIF